MVFLESVRRLQRSSYGQVVNGIGFSRNTDYYYEDIIAMAIHPDGEKHWHQVMRKQQYSYGDDGIYSSFITMATPSLIHVVYNDEIKRDNTVSAYTVDGLGRMDRSSVMSTQFQNLGLKFVDALQVGPTSLVVPSEHGRELRLVRMDLL